LLSASSETDTRKKQREMPNEQLSNVVAAPG